ncbi:MAG TPA: CpaF family protein [Lachnospiraceae bacterium]|nr:CpaF family protein [Lachnospiraceae bacterium]HPF28755.1 CpaF family protein [Lachnospiraceae bacterium]
MDLQAIRQELKTAIQNQISYAREQEDEEIQELIDTEVLKCAKEHFLPYQLKEQLAREMFYAIRKLDILQELTEDPLVTEIMINGKDHIFVERDGRLFRWDKQFESNEKLEDVIQQIVAHCNRCVNEASPIVDARLQNGSRVNIVLAPVALNGPIVTIRRFPEHPIQMKDLVRFGALDEEVVHFLQQLVIAGYNIFISGGTGSGKTTFLNALSDFIPKDERIITIEDSAELQITGVLNLVRMETRNANVEGCKEISIRDLIKSSLRMRPDRIIVGEVRGSEAIDMIQALNTGHDGSLSTGHANSARDMLSRLETMTLMGMDLPLSAIRGQIASGIDIIVHLGRLRDKSRKVLEIVEVLSLVGDRIETSVLYQFEETGDNGKIIGTLKKVNELQNIEKLRSAGLAAGG